MSEFRGLRVGNVKETMQQEYRFHNMKNHDLNRNRWIKIKFGPLILVHVGLSRIECWICQRTFTTGIPISRYVKSRCNLSRQIKVESGPLIPVLVGVLGIESWTCQRLLTSGISISRCNLNRQIKIWSGSLIRLLYKISWIRICKWQEHWTSGMPKFWNPI